MKALILLVAVSLLWLPCHAAATIITVDCNGGAMHTDLRAAILSGGASDTVLVSPCTYFADPGVPPWVTLWPIELTSNSPTIMSTDGATSTIIEGDGTIPAFVITEEAARVDIHGMTFTNLTAALENTSGLPSSKFIFVDNIVEYCSAGLNASCTPGSAVVSGNIIRYNGGTGIGVYHNSGVIEYNEVCHNTAGIIGACCEDPTIRSNHVHHNSGTGISIVFAGTVESNTIEDNSGIGLRLFGYGSIESNVIRRNNVGVGVWDRGSFNLYCNDIYENTLHNLEALPYIGSCTIDATMNWWGTTDPDEIETGIWDCNDDPSLAACVVFEPWALGPGCIPVPVEASSWGAIKAMYR